MKSVKRALGFCKNYGRAFIRTIPFLWTAAPKEMLALCIFLILQGVFPAFSIWLTKQVVDTAILGCVLKLQPHHDGS